MNPSYHYLLLFVLFSCLPYFHTEAVAQESTEVTEEEQLATYQSGDTLQVGQRQYVLQFLEADRKTAGARLNDGQIEIEFPLDYPPENRTKTIQSLLSRIVAKDFLPAITERVNELNEQHFQQTVTRVRLRYSKTSWGTCSSSGNVRLSTRLLFAPPEVIDYVIIHELAHLIEFNHTNRFHELVAQAMPEYEEHKAWLLRNGAQCDF